MYYNIRKKLYNEPWLITADMHRSMCEQLEYFAETGQPMVAPKEDETPKLTCVDGVAVIPIFGVIGKHLSLMETTCGGCDVDSIRAQIATAVSDPSAKNLVLYFNSPGGTSTGVEELAEWIGEQSQIKPIYAYCDGLMCSAAYWLASQCSNIIVSPSCKCGSVGVYTLLLDQSEKLKKEGVVITPIYKGDNKLTGAPFRALSDEEKQMFQAGVDKLYNKFVTAVKSTRTIEDKYLQGWTYDGEESVEHGFADGVINSITDLITLLKENQPKTITP